MKKLSIIEISVSDKFRNLDSGQHEVINWLLMHELDGTTPDLTDLLILGTSVDDISFIDIVAGLSRGRLIDDCGRLRRDERHWR